MGKWIHRLENINTKDRQAICLNCGIVRIIKADKVWRCLIAFRFYSDPRYRRNKKKICEKCGFIPQHKCQLDVDHIDGNHNNNSENNLQTLCANCHRLKTFKHILKLSPL